MHASSGLQSKMSSSKQAGVLSGNGCRSLNSNLSRFTPFVQRVQHHGVRSRLTSRAASEGQSLFNFWSLYCSRHWVCICFGRKSLGGNLDWGNLDAAPVLVTSLFSCYVPSENVLSWIACLSVPLPKLTASYSDALTVCSQPYWVSIALRRASIPVKLWA